MADAVFDINKMRVNDIIKDIDGYIQQVEDILEFYGDRRINEIRETIHLYETTGKIKDFNTDTRDILKIRLWKIKVLIDTTQKTYDSMSDYDDMRSFTIYETADDLYSNVAEVVVGNRQFLKQQIDTYISWFCSLNIDINNINKQLRNTLGIIGEQYSLNTFYVKHTTTIEYNIGQLYCFQYNKNRKLKNLLRKISNTYTNYQEFIMDIGAMYNKCI